MSASKAIRVLGLTSVILVLFGIVRCSQFTPSGTEFTISVHELKEKIATDSSIVIIDIRTRRELKSGIIPSAEWVDFNDPGFVGKVAEYSGSTIYLYCHSGRRSEAALEELLNKGYKNIYHVSGGMNSWKKNDYKTEQPFN